MTKGAFHLAQINIARMRTPLTDPNMSDFIAQLEEVNGLADESAGFVWRLADDSGNAATDVRIPGDDRVLVNMSVWESVEALQAFSYKGRHAELLRHRSKWFEPGSTRLVMWWIPAGSIPSVEEAIDKLDTLEKDGPTREAFTFRELFPAPD